MSTARTSSCGTSARLRQLTSDVETVRDTIADLPSVLVLVVGSGLARQIAATGIRGLLRGDTAGARLAASLHVVEQG